MDYLDYLRYYGDYYWNSLKDFKALLTRAKNLYVLGARH